MTYIYSQSDKKLIKLDNRIIVSGEIDMLNNPVNSYYKLFNKQINWNNLIIIGCIINPIYKCICRNKIFPVGFYNLDITDHNIYLFCQKCCNHSPDIYQYKFLLSQLLNQKSPHTVTIIPQTFNITNFENCLMCDQIFYKYYKYQYCQSCYQELKIMTPLYQCVDCGKNFHQFNIWMIKCVSCYRH